MIIQGQKCSIKGFLSLKIGMKKAVLLLTKALYGTVKKLILANLTMKTSN